MDTVSPVAQLLPQLNVKIDFTKIHSCVYHGSFSPSCVADRLDLFGGREQPAEDLGGIAAEELEQEEHEQDDPAQASGSSATACVRYRRPRGPLSWVFVRACSKPTVARESADYADAASGISNRAFSTCAHDASFSIPMSDAALSRRGFAAVAARARPARSPSAPPRRRDAAPARKVLRYAFRVAETGFDPAQINDLYSRTSPPTSSMRRTTTTTSPGPSRSSRTPPRRCPRSRPTSATLTFRIRPGIFFQDDPAFKGKPRELVAADYVYSLKRFFDPR